MTTSTESWRPHPCLLFPTVSLDRPRFQHHPTLARRKEVTLHLCFTYYDGRPQVRNSPDARVAGRGTPSALQICLLDSGLPRDKISPLLRQTSSLGFAACSSLGEATSAHPPPPKKLGVLPALGLGPYCGASLGLVPGSARSSANTGLNSCKVGSSSVFARAAEMR